MLLQKAPQRFRRCNFSLDVNIKKEKMNDDTIFIPIEMPSGQIRRFRVPAEIVPIMKQLREEHPEMDSSEAALKAMDILKEQQSGDAQQ